MPDPNTSATGGYLVPASSPAVMNGAALNAFMQGVIAGVTGLAGTLVRPSWQANPPPVPAFEVSWCAFGVTITPIDFEADQIQGDESSTFLRHEELNVSCVFYGADSQANMARLRDGLLVAQNREPLYLAGMGFVGTGEPVHVPELVNERWIDRWDMTVTLRREVVRVYPILPLLGAYGSIEGNDAGDGVASRDWTAGNEYVPEGD